MATNGSIKFLKQKKHNQYAVHPPTTEFTKDGVPITPKALCYVDDWYKGFAVLTAYKAGTYKKGMEKDLSFTDKPDDAIKRIITDYSHYTGADSRASETFSDVFELYYKDKYTNSKKRLSIASERATKAAYKNCVKLHGKPFKQITLDDLQSVVDSCQLKHASLELIVSLFKGMYKYAVPHGITDKDFSQYVKINIPDDDEHGIPFTEEDILTMWNCRDDLTASRLLVMCYTGFRISAYKSIIKTTTYFQGGVKTKASKNRIVPIHSAITELTDRFDMSGISYSRFSREMSEFLKTHGIDKHTPHDCRHTFSMLCDKYHVDNIAKKKLLGHSLSGDLANGTYGHWDYSMLKQEIEKIRVPWKFY